MAMRFHLPAPAIRSRGSISLGRRHGGRKKKFTTRGRAGRLILELACGLEPCDSLRALHNRSLARDKRVAIGICRRKNSSITRHRRSYQGTRLGPSMIA